MSACPVLSDRGSAVIRAFGLPNESHAAGSFAHGVAHPAIFVIDADGVVRHRFAEEDYRDRPDPAAVLKAAAGTPPPSAGP